MFAIQVNKSYLVELTSLLWHYFSMEFCWVMVSRMSPFWSSTWPFGTMMLFPLCQRRHPQATAGTCQVHSDQAPVQVDGITTMESRHHLRVLPGTEESIWPGYGTHRYIQRQEPHQRRKAETGQMVQQGGETGNGCFLHCHWTFHNHYETILNFFVNRATNAGAESFNAKVKAFRAQFRGVADIPFFLFRLMKLWA